MPLTDLNSPEEQARAAQEKEAAAKLAADQQRWVEEDHAEHGNAIDTAVMGGINAVDDFFSAEQVGGPKAGTWGQSGTAAAGYNAGAQQAGAGIANNAQAQGSAALGAAGSTATNLLGQANGASTRAAPTTNYAGADRYAGFADSSRNRANALVNEAGSSAQQDAQLYALNQFANQGPGASAAQAQLASAGDAAQLSALSMARSGRGAGDSAASLRDAMFANAQTQGTTAGQLASLRATEEATHRQQQLQALDAAMGGAGAIRNADTAAAQVAQGTRAQDLQAQGQAAGQSQFNTTSQQNQTQLNDNLKLGLTNAALGYTSEGNQTNLGFNQLGIGAQTDYAQLGQNALNAQADYELEQQNMKLQADIANQQADLEKDSGISGMLGAAAGAIGLSDKRVKELEARESALADALETVGNAPGYSYEYKDPDQPGAKRGRQIGPMAQDLEKGPLGDTIVTDTPQGKMVDYGRVAMLGASAITELNRKVKALESALGKVA